MDLNLGPLGYDPELAGQATRTIAEVFHAPPRRRKSSTLTTGKPPFLFEVFHDHSVRRSPPSSWSSSSLEALIIARAFVGDNSGSDRSLIDTLRNSAVRYMSLKLHALPLFIILDTACGTRPRYAAKSLRYLPSRCISISTLRSAIDCGSVACSCAGGEMSIAVISAMLNESA